MATNVVTEYKWTDHNRLASIETKLAGVSTGDIKQSNTFGINGFRRKKKDKNDVETTEYAAGLATAVSKAQGGDTVTYLMGHRLMGFERSSDGAMFWFITDSLSTVRDVVRGTDGAVMASYEFSEYGQRISAPNTGGVESQKTFVGGMSVQDEVADTGLMMMGHRFYDPSGPAGGTGRFLNRDPIGYRGGLNLFEYARSSPIQLADPRGLNPPESALDRRGGNFLPPQAYPEITEEQAVMMLAFVPILGDGIAIAEFLAAPTVFGGFTTLFSFVPLVGNAGSLASKALPSHFPGFDPAKLERIGAALKTECVAVEVGTRRAYRNLRGQAGMVEPASSYFGTKASVFLEAAPARIAVIEELIHIGQLRKLGFPDFLTDDLAIKLEIEAQEMLLKLAARKGWTADEVKSISDYKALWESM